jgi:GNAT superfamily N-acetyltransferase
VLIRLPRVDELPALSALCLRSKAVWGYDADFMAACVDELTLTGNSLSAHVVGVLERGDAPLGLVEVSMDAEYAELEKLFVDPPFMGRGYGTILMRWAVEAARTAGHDRMMIAADPAAAAFYARHGAVQVGDIESASIPGRRLPWMELRLQLPSG